METKVEPQVLSYAKPSRFGIEIVRIGPMARVIAPTRALRTMLVSSWFFVLVLLVRTIAQAQDGAYLSRDSIVLGGLIVAVIALQWCRRVFAVNERDVRVGYSWRGMTAWTQVWPRETVGEIKYSSINKMLIIRITGKDMHEYHLPGDAQAKEQVAAALQEALAESPPHELRLK